jgi:hydrogenase maturation protease
VIGVGNPDRADDGVGPLVAARLAEQLSGMSHIDVVECRGDVLALMDRWGAADTVVLIDAATTAAAAAGRIHRFDICDGLLPREVSLCSTHDVGVAQTIALAAALEKLPRRVILYAVEARCFRPGASMTEEVTAAAARLPQLIVAALDLQRH